MNKKKDLYLPLETVTVDRDSFRFLQRVSHLEGGRIMKTVHVPSIARVSQPIR
jgi:hypothetical protein